MLFLQKILSGLADQLLGPEEKRSFICEFYGDSGICLLPAVFEHIHAGKIIAYLDPYEHGLAYPLPEKVILLKPKDLEETLQMSMAMLEMPQIDVLIVHSLFWLPAKLNEFERGLGTLAQKAESAQKPLFLLNPENGVRNWLKKNLGAFCSHQIRVDY